MLFPVMQFTIGKIIFSVTVGLVLCLILLVKLSKYYLHTDAVAAVRSSNLEEAVVNKLLNSLLNFSLEKIL